MASANISISYNAPVSASSASFPIGTCLIRAGNSYAPCTVASMGSLVTFDGVALDAGTPNGVVRIQSDGIIPADVTGLGAGTVAYARLNLTTSKLERAATLAGSDITFGVVREDGSVDRSSQALAPAKASILTEYRTCTLRGMGAVGGSATLDSAAYDAAMTAINANTYDQLIVEAGAYDLSNATGYLSRGNTRIRGQASKASILQSTANKFIVHIRGVTEGVVIQDLGFSGSGKGSGLSNQNAVEDGYFGADGTSDLTVFNITAADMGGRCVSWAYPPSPGLTGPRMYAIRALRCLYGAYGAGPGQLVNSNFDSCNTGVNIASGNIQVEASTFFSNTTGVNVVSGGNDGHSIVSGCLIDHTTGDAVVVGATTNPMTFTGNHIYQGGINLTGTAGTSALVTFLMGIIDFTTFTGNACFAQFDDVRFDDAYFVATAFTNDCDVEVTNTCRYARASKELPAWASALQRQQLTFSADANQTLTRQQNRAQILEVLAGVITVPRTLFGVRSPTRGYRQRVVNRNGQRVDFKGPTGTGVQIPSNTWHDIEADGTNLIGMGNGSAAYTPAP